MLISAAHVVFKAWQSFIYNLSAYPNYEDPEVQRSLRKHGEMKEEVLIKG
jgi:hypothetical protein